MEQALSKTAFMPQRLIRKSIMPKLRRSFEFGRPSNELKISLKKLKTQKRKINNEYQARVKDLSFELAPMSCKADQSAQKNFEAYDYLKFLISGQISQKYLKHTIRSISIDPKKEYKSSTSITPKFKNITTNTPKVRRNPHKSIDINISLPIIKHDYQSEMIKILQSLNGVRPTHKLLAKRFKFYVKGGNHASMITRIMQNKRWWKQTINIREANFIWTSKRNKQVFESLNPMNVKRCKQVKIGKVFNIDDGMQLISQAKAFRQQPEIIITDPYMNKIYNKLYYNTTICSKSRMFTSLKKYCNAKDIQLTSIIPYTLLIKQGVHDKQLNKFIKSNNNQQLWILKPGEFSNQGKGIIVTKQNNTILDYIRNTSSKHSIILQKYISNPLLFKNRKFDIRVFCVLVSINNSIKAYFYKEGYIRTSSNDFSTKKIRNKFIHLTNDAVQKKSISYGKFESSNKISFTELENHVKQFQPDFNFDDKILSQMMDKTKLLIKATYNKLIKNNKWLQFEVLGLDFMIDDELDVLLIEANTNPSFDTSCSLLTYIIPNMLSNAIDIVLDPIFPQQKACIEPSYLKNKFALIFNKNLN